MANWNDPQPGMGFGASPSLSGVQTRGEVFDAGLRRYMLSIYNYMASGVLLSGVVALLAAQSGFAASLFGTPLRWVVALAPLAFVMVMSFGINRISTTTLKGLFWAFSVTISVG